MTLDSFFRGSDGQFRPYRDYLQAFKEQKNALAVCRRSVVLLTSAFAPVAAVFRKMRGSLREVVEREIVVGDEISTTVNAMTEQYDRELEPLLHYVQRLVKRIEARRATKPAEIVVAEYHTRLEYLRSLQPQLDKIAQDAARERIALSERDALLYGGEAGLLAQTSKITLETLKTVGMRLAERQEHLRATHRVYLGNIELGRASDYIRKSIRDLRLSSEAIYTEVERSYTAITHLFTSSRTPLFPQGKITFLPRPDKDDEDNKDDEDSLGVEQK